MHVLGNDMTKDWTSAYFLLCAEFEALNAWVSLVLYLSCLGEMP
jgi:hypothetical protein